MLSEDQFLNIKNIYTLFINISDYANTWINELKISDDIQIHKDKLTIIMNLITNVNELIDGDLDDILIIVEENLKEYIVSKYIEENIDEVIDSDSDSDRMNTYK
jgi:hypothetical protein